MSDFTGLASLTGLTRDRHLRIIKARIPSLSLSAAMNKTPTPHSAQAKAAYIKPQAVELSVQITEGGMSGADELMAMGMNILRKIIGS